MKKTVHTFLVILTFMLFVFNGSACLYAQSFIKRQKTNEKKFSFSGGLFGADMLMRSNIYGKWEKVPLIVVGFNATITYKK